MTQALRTYSFAPDECHRCASPYAPTYPSSWICPRCEAVIKAFPIRPDSSDESLGPWGSLPEVARRQIISYLVLDYTLLYRLHFLQRSLLRRGSLFHQFTDERMGREARVSPGEDILDRILYYLSPPRSPVLRTLAKNYHGAWSWCIRVHCMRFWADAVIHRFEHAFLDGTWRE